MKIACLILSTLLIIYKAEGQTTDTQKMEDLTSKFDQGLNSLNIPDITLDFKQYIINQVNAANIKEQRDFFLEVKSMLKHIEFHNLQKSLQLDFKIIEFEVDTNLERINLIQTFKGDLKKVTQIDKIYDLPNGPAWHSYLIKKWTGSNQIPDQIMKFGLTEIKRIKTEIKKLNLSSEKPQSYYTRNTSDIEAKLKKREDQIEEKLPLLFPDFLELPKLIIDKGTNTQLAQAPGYYSENTFFYNLFDTPFDLSDIDWLLLHEGNPGHHFEVNYHQELSVKPYRNRLQFMGYVEGWAAYVENLGWEMGLYVDPFEALGKWNWDLIRSVRVYLDVAMNYKGWSDQQALDFWKRNIQGKDDIGRREIARMKRWPAQVLAYKLGEAQMLKMLEVQKTKLGTEFDYKTFNSSLLNSGTLPVTLIPMLFN